MSDPQTTTGSSMSCWNMFITGCRCESILADEISLISSASSYNAPAKMIYSVIGGEFVINETEYIHDLLRVRGY